MKELTDSIKARFHLLKKVRARMKSRKPVRLPNSDKDRRHASKARIWPSLPPECDQDNWDRAGRGRSRRHKHLVRREKAKLMCRLNKREKSMNDSIANKSNPRQREKDNPSQFDADVVVARAIRYVTLPSSIAPASSECQLSLNQLDHIRKCRFFVRRSHSS